jgi:cystathionine beta-lyase/cystathionine gamma-synthase
MERHSQNAQRIAEHLERHARVARVFYPGLRSHPQHELAKAQMRAPGGMVSFEIKGSVEEAKQVASAFRVFALAESLGGVESLVDHPATMTHGSIPAQERRAAGFADGLIRLSVGIEDIADLIADCDHALARR